MKHLESVPVPGWSCPAQEFAIVGETLGVVSGHQARVQESFATLRSGIFFTHEDPNGVATSVRIHRPRYGPLPRQREVQIDGASGRKWVVRAGIIGANLFREDGVRVGGFRYWGTYVADAATGDDKAILMGVLANAAQNHAFWWLFAGLRYYLPSLEEW